MLETNFQKIYTTGLAKESIFYKTHSMSRQPVNFFLLVKVTIYVMKYGSFGKGLVENLQSRGGNGCFDTNQRFSFDAYESSTLAHK